MSGTSTLPGVTDKNRRSARLRLGATLSLALGLAGCGAPATVTAGDATATAGLATTAPPATAATTSPSALPTPALQQPTPGKVPPSSDCPPSGVTAVFGGSDAAMGLRVVGLKLINCSTRRQRVRGYPAINLFDAKRKPLPIKVKPGAVAMADPDPGPRSLVLEPGKTAVAVLSWRNTVLADGTDTLTGEYASLAALPGEPARRQRLHVDAGTTKRVAVTAWQLPKEPKE